MINDVSIQIQIQSVKSFCLRWVFFDIKYELLKGYNSYDAEEAR